MISLKDILLANGAIYNIEKDEYMEKDILIKNGKIAEISENITCLLYTYPSQRD